MSRAETASNALRRGELVQAGDLGPPYPLGPRPLWLVADAWAAGKGAFKLLQYMAAGLPCVASPVGMNREVVVERATGYLAADDRAWRDSLRAILRSPEKRSVMGRVASRRVERKYDLQVIAPRVAELYEQACIAPRQARI